MLTESKITHRLARLPTSADDRPLVVVLMSTEPHLRGGELQLRQLGIGLRSRGHQVHLVARQASPLAEVMADEGFAVHGVQRRGSSPPSLWKLRGAMRAIAPDVIHFNDTHALLAGGLATAGMPLVRVASRRLMFPIRSAWKYRRCADAVIAVSHAVRQSCVGSGLRPDQVRVVHDGVRRTAPTAPREHIRQSLGLIEAETMLLFVAALTSEKGHRYLIDAMPTILRSTPNAVLVCAGDGALRGEIQQQAQALGVAGHVRMLGQRSDVADLLAAADLFVFPSLSEGLPNSLIEAMHGGLPVVSSTAGGCAEVAGVGAPGGPFAWMTPPADAAALAATVAAALASPAESARLGRLAQQRSLQLFDPDRMVDETLTVYRVLVERKRLGRARS